MSYADKVFIQNCKDNNLPFEKEVCGGSTGTNAWPIQVAGLGTKCLVISVPIKYMHTPSELCSVGDAMSVSNILSEVIKNLDVLSGEKDTLLGIRYLKVGTEI